MTLSLQRATDRPRKPPAMTAFWPDTKDRVADGTHHTVHQQLHDAALFGVPRGQLAADWAKDIGSPFGEATTGRSRTSPSTMPSSTRTTGSRPSRTTSTR